MLTRRFPILAVLAFATSPLAAVAEVQAPARVTRAEAELLAAEDARFAAQIRRDVPAIAAGMADELTYVHATGRRMTKAEYLAGMAAGAAGRGGPAYRALIPADRVAHVSGTMGWTRAVLTQQMSDRAMTSSYLAIYVKRAGHWQLLSWQTTPNDAPAAPAPNPATAK